MICILSTLICDVLIWKQGPRQPRSLAASNSSPQQLCPLGLSPSPAGSSSQRLTASIRPCLLPGPHPPRVWKKQAPPPGQSPLPPSGGPGSLTREPLHADTSSHRALLPPLIPTECTPQTAPHPFAHAHILRHLHTPGPWPLAAWPRRERCPYLVEALLGLGVLPLHHFGQV